MSCGYKEIRYPHEPVRYIRLKNLANCIGEHDALQIFDVIRHENNVYPFHYEMQRLDVLISLAYGFRVPGHELLKIAKMGIESIALQTMQATVRPSKGGTPCP